MQGLVDILWGLSLLANRAKAVNADFLLSGPINHWLQGVTSRPRQPRFVLLTSPSYEKDLVKALTIGSRPEDYPGDVKVEEGLSLHVNLKGMSISLLTNPVIRDNGRLLKINVRNYARTSIIIGIDNYFVRLSPIFLEKILWRLE